MFLSTDKGLLNTRYVAKIVRIRGGGHVCLSEDGREMGKVSEHTPEEVMP